MREEKRTEQVMNTIKVVSFIADDGTEFKAHNWGKYEPEQSEIDRAKKQCSDYETSCEYAIKFKFAKFSRLVKFDNNIKEGDKLPADFILYKVFDQVFAQENGESDYWICNPRNEDDIATMLQMYKTWNWSEIRNFTKDFWTAVTDSKLLEVGKTYIFKNDPEGEYCAIFNIDRVIDILTKTKTMIATGEETFGEQFNTWK